MLAGRFGNTTGRPYIECRVILPRFGLSGDFSFLIDTGADGSLLMPGDGRLLKLDFSQLVNERVAQGIGGGARTFTESALLTFADGQNVFGYFVELGILEDSDEMASTPSLIGRDILRRWNMDYRPLERRLTIDVISADVLVPAASVAGIVPGDLRQ